MERCPHCGAATRPGAKFCTSCGTRLDDQAAAKPDQSVWGDTSATGETQVDSPAVVANTTEPDAEITADESNQDVVTNQAPATEADVATETDATSSDSIWSASASQAETSAETEDVPTKDAASWSNEWPDSTDDKEDDSPADRLRDALNTGDNAPTSSVATDTGEQSFPERNVWSWDGTSNDETTSDESPASPETETTGVADVDAEIANDEEGESESEPEPEPESTWTSPLGNHDDTDEVATESETITPEKDDAGFSREGQVDYLSGDESLSTDEQNTNAVVATATTTEGSAGDSRQRASTLVDELRGLIWTIGGDDSTTADDNQGIIANMKRVRGEISDFTDLERVISAVQENPRDIDSLRELGQKADRLQALLDSHTALTGALEDAIRQGS